MNILIIPVFLFSILLSILVIRSTVSLMHTLSIAGMPDDEHKRHDINTPFVGGVGVLLSLLLVFNDMINWSKDRTAMKATMDKKVA